MALSTRSWNELLEMPSGVAKNARPLAKRLGSRRALEEMVEAGHLNWAGGRVLRTRMSEHAFQLFDTIPEDGSTIGNSAARTSSGLTTHQYSLAKDLLLKTGEISRGRGQGGSVRRLAGVDIGSRSGAVSRESEMYEPFREWIAQRESSVGVKFATRHITANGRAQRRATGQWSKPDVVSVAVIEHDMLPGADVVVRAYELKPYAYASDLKGVFEASAHQRKATFASLVIEWPAGSNAADPPQQIVDECSRLGVGLYLAWGGEAEVVIEPVRQAPDPALLSDFIDDVITHQERTEYLTAIGRPADIETLPDED